MQNSTARHERLVVVSRHRVHETERCWDLPIRSSGIRTITLARHVQGQSIPPIPYAVRQFGFRPELSGRPQSRILRIVAAVCLTIVSNRPASLKIVAIQFGELLKGPA